MTLINKNLFACRKKVRTTQPITTKHSSCFSGNGHYLVSFWRNSVRNPLFGKNSSKISDVFFHGQHSLGHNYGMVGPIDVKRKGGVSVRYG